jgi:hypothetical protein
MAHKTHLTVESLESKALLSGLSDLAASSFGGPLQLRTNGDPIPMPVNPGAGSAEVTSGDWTPPQLRTNPDPIPLPPVNPGAGSGASSSSSSWSPPQLQTNGDPIPGPLNPGTASATPAPNPVQIVLTTNRPAYRHGHPVHIKITVTNAGTSSVSLSPDAIAKGLTVSHGSRLVWRSGHRGHNLSVEALQPGQSIVLKTVWNARAHHPGSGGPAPGLYTIQASVAGATASATIRIR